MPRHKSDYELAVREACRELTCEHSINHLQLGQRLLHLALVHDKPGEARAMRKDLARMTEEGGTR